MFPIARYLIRGRGWPGPRISLILIAILTTLSLINNIIVWQHFINIETLLQNGSQDMPVLFWRLPNLSTLVATYLPEVVSLMVLMTIGWFMLFILIPVVCLLPLPPQMINDPQQPNIIQLTPLSFQQWRQIHTIAFLYLIRSMIIIALGLLPASILGAVVFTEYRALRLMRQSNLKICTSILHELDITCIPKDMLNHSFLISSFGLIALSLITLIILLVLVRVHPDMSPSRLVAVLFASGYLFITVMIIWPLWALTVDPPSLWILGVMAGGPALLSHSMVKSLKSEA